MEAMALTAANMCVSGLRHAFAMLKFFDILFLYFDTCRPIICHDTKKE
jgi:hypothetical protein